MKASRYPIVEVLWVDSAQLEAGEWMPVEAVRVQANDLGQRSIGYVIFETDMTLVIARSLSEWTTDNVVEKVEGVLCIPKASITERREK